MRLRSVKRISLEVSVAAITEENFGLRVIMPAARQARNAEELLRSFTTLTGRSSPNFVVVKETSDTYICTVEINQRKYQSYPKSQPTAELARICAAAKALKNLGEWLLLRHFSRLFSPGSI